jgi:hypothetical protein
MTTTKLTNGLNDRPKGETIAQTGTGIPDDTSRPPELDEEEADKIEQKIRAMGTKGGKEAQKNVQAQVQQDIDLPLKGSA